MDEILFGGGPVRTFQAKPNRWPFDEFVPQNPAVSTVLEHLLVFEVLASQTSFAEKREHARRIVDAVLALQVKP